MFGANCDRRVYEKSYKMVKCKKGFWCFVFLMSFIDLCTGNVRVELKMPRYVERGHNATLHCVHSADPDIVYKVEWLKAGNKIFQYVKDRTPPYRNYSFVGGILDWHSSDDKQIKLTNLDFAAAGEYSCIVSLEYPIYTKESQQHELEVILPQSSEPRITFEKAVYNVGETLVANCTTSVARPPPHITWLINDQKVNEAMVKSFSTLHGRNSRNGLHMRGQAHHHHTDFSVSQLSVEVSELHAGENGQLTLTCISTIPGYLGHGEKYADIRAHTVTIDVAIVDITASPEIARDSAISTTSVIVVHSIILFLLHYLLINILDVNVNN